MAQSYYPPLLTKIVLHQGRRHYGCHEAALADKCNRPSVGEATLVPSTPMGIHQHLGWCKSEFPHSNFCDFAWDREPNVPSPQVGLQQLKTPA